MLPKFSGSAIDKFYNCKSEHAAELRKFLAGISRQLDAAIESNSAQGKHTSSEQN